MGDDQLTKYQQLVIACVLPFQELEGVLQQLILLRNVNNATGWIEDQIGEIVGQQRNALDDDTYRLYLLARIATNKSAGKREQLIAICKLVQQDPSMVVRVLNEGIAGSTIRLEETIPTKATADALIQFLRAAAADGIKIVLETATATDALSFTFGLQAYVTSPVTAGNTSISVGSTAGFPATGTLDLEPGLAGEEPGVTYTGTTSTSFTGIPPSGAGSIANSHGVGAEVQSVEGSPGLGFGLQAYAAAPIAPGATSIQVGSTTGFPSSGTLDLEPGVSGEEQAVTYTSTNATHFLGIPASGAGSIANIHGTGAEVQFNGSPQIGGDFADART